MKLSGKFCRIIRLSLLMLSVCLMPVGAVVEMNEENESYIFDNQYHTMDAPTPYVLSKTLTAADFGEKKLGSLDDVCAAPDGSLYLADSEGHTVYKWSVDGSEAKALRSFSVGDATVSLQSPTGIFVSKEGELYVADKTDGRIFIFDVNMQYRRSILPPSADEILSDQPYAPLRVCADSGGRVYVIAANQTQGILQFSPSGDFKGFLGATRVEPSLWDRVWRAISTAEQKKSLLRLIPTEYNSMALDADDFLYTTVGALSEEDVYAAIRSGSEAAMPVRRLNPKGEDVLLRQGTYPPVGDVNFEFSYQAGKGQSQEELRGASRLIDVTCRNYGVYTVLDGQRGRVYTYDKSGNLLFMFGGSGKWKGQMNTPTAIAYVGDDLVVTDTEVGVVYWFSPTPYAQRLMKAVECHEMGLYEQEETLWKAIQREYVSSQAAALGLGKADMERKEYLSAMENFRLAGDREYYSKAWKAYRTEWGYAHVGWLFGCIGLMAFAAFILVKIVKRRTAEAYVGSPAHRAWYARGLLLHPLRTFGEIKEGRIGTVGSATLLLGAAFLLSVLRTVTAPYLLQNESNSSLLQQGFMTIALLVGLFVLANWCLTSLMDGKGTMKDIYIYTCYSLTPLLIIEPILLLLGQFITLDELPLFQFISQLAVVTVLWLIFCGTLVVHDYGPGKTLGMLLLTVVGMMILVFIALLCMTLLQQIVLYIRNILTEWQLR